MFSYFKLPSLTMSSTVTTVTRSVTSTVTPTVEASVSAPPQMTIQLQPSPENCTVYRKDYKPSVYTAKHVSINFDLSLSATKVTTDLYMSRLSGGTGPVDLILDGEDLTLLDVHLTRSDSDVSHLLEDKNVFGKIEGARKLSTERNEYRVLDAPDDCKGKLWINGNVLPSSPDVLFKLMLRVLVNPEENLRLSGLYKSGTLLCTQCEAEGFRRITYALDRPDILSTFRVRLEADADTFPVLLSNGNRIETGTVPASAEGENNKAAGRTGNQQDNSPPAKIARVEPATRHFAVFEDPFPKPCYLFALVAGNLACKEDVFRNGDKGDVRLSLWCEPQEKARLDWAMQSLKFAMQWDIDTYGLHYDLDWFNIVAVPNFNFGAMENKSLNIFNSALLLCCPKTSTDKDFITIMSVVGHEYFHNWTGNRVTCRDWFQLTLKEGLTVYREQEFHASKWSRAVSRIEDVQTLKFTQFPEDSGPLAHPVRPDSYIAVDNFYTATVYEKGAEIIRMYETLLGVDGFKKGLALYFKRHDGQAATCEDFLRAMVDANNAPRLEAMEHWYSTSGTPVMRVDNERYDPENKRFSFTLTQTSPATTALLLPVRVGLIGRDSKKDLISTKVLEHNSLESQEYVLDNVEEDCVLSILRGFSAPVHLDYSMSDDTLNFLLAHDTDPYNQWAAGQTLASRVILNYAQEITKAQTSAVQSGDIALAPLPESLVAAYRQILSTDHEDLAFQSLLLNPPDVASLIDSAPAPCDPVAIAQAREFLKYSLARHLNTYFKAIHERLSCDQKPYQVVYTDVGARSLRNLCLSYLTASDPFNPVIIPEQESLAASCFTEASNMTDRIGALACLKNMDVEFRDKAFDMFYQEGKGNDSIMTKWFALHASSALPGVLDTVLKLKEHPDFKSTNANYIRSLIGSFGHNTIQFHRADGKGYSLYADAILEVDKFNSQVAARLATRFSNWRKFAEPRQDLIKKELQRLLAAPNVSKECYEICSKALY